MRYNLMFKIFVGAVLLGSTAPAGIGEPLKEVYAQDFLIGNVMGNGPSYRAMRKDPIELEVLVREFNCLTAENLMKSEYLQPEPGKFNFKEADEFVAFAEQHNMKVVGHALVWHSQVPSWLFVDEQGQLVSREVMIERMRNHIHTVVGRYKGRIHYWDVVNEAVETKMVVDESLPLDEEGNPQEKRVAFYRDSLWRQIIGDDYIELAFKFAHEADPNARLLYNDYAMNQKEKAQFVAEMVKDLKAKGTPIHEVGIQGHWHLDYDLVEDLQSAIDMYVSAGVKVSITELDIGILPLAIEHQGADISENVELRAELNPYTKGIPAELLQQQAEKYQEIFEVMLQNREHIERVSFWGVSDKYTWLDFWPVNGRTTAPLLFDRNFQPKPAYDMLLQRREASHTNSVVVRSESSNSDSN